MTTPNIEWLIGHLRSFSGTSLAPALMHQAADTLQSQAERIKELEKQHIERLLRIEKEVDVLVAERDELRRRLTHRVLAHAAILAWPITGVSDGVRPVPKASRKNQSRSTTSVARSAMTLTPSTPARDAARCRTM